MNNVKYYECHVTVEPCFDERLEKLKSVAAWNRFNVADLLMKKRATDLEIRSAKDSFCTSRSVDLADLSFRMERLCTELQIAGFQVWRKKIEAVIYDERLRQPPPLPTHTEVHSGNEDA